jgi:hypothetical protein
MTYSLDDKINLKFHFSTELWSQNDWVPEFLLNISDICSFLQLIMNIYV